MASPERPSSNLPPSLGPGARPVQPGEPTRPAGIAEIMNFRSKYSVSVEPETLHIGYEINRIPRTYHLAFESMPLGTFSRWALFGGPSRTRNAGTQVIDFIRGTENIIGRPLSQREAEGYAYHTSKKMLYGLTGTAVGVLIGGVIAQRNREKMKFPFRSAQPLENYQNFPNRYLPILRGQTALFAWRATRVSVWTVVGIFIARPIFAAIGNTVFYTGLNSDDRTKDLMDSIKGNLEQIASNRVREVAAGTRPRPQPQGQQDVQSAEPDSQAYYRDTQQDVTNDYQGDYSADNTFTDGSTDTGVTNDASMRAREARQPASVFRGSYGRPAPSTQQSRSQSDQPKDSFSGSASDPFFDDDASPTAGNDPNMGTPSTYSPQRSAWARIRNQQNQGYSGGRENPPTERSSGMDRGLSDDPYAARRGEEQARGDAFSFSKPDADRQLAKDQAQKEFDAMLDKERRLSGSDEYDRGMNAVAYGEESAASSGLSAWESRRRR
ncbi:hypothetical protein PV11_02797 [Exophiala sideris]|uniref:Uncharacterized protein n=1 Tax=Exophiala sideris TaxID=1016849 RepID=A0A0D1Z0A4_9EURO|nr:hypothetical protein PV11_02797 [Exophiala sideris]